MSEATETQEKRIFIVVQEAGELGGYSRNVIASQDEQEAQEICNKYNKMLLEDPRNIRQPGFGGTETVKSVELWAEQFPEYISINGGHLGCINLPITKGVDLEAQKEFVRQYVLKRAPSDDIIPDAELSINRAITAWNSINNKVEKASC